MGFCVSPVSCGCFMDYLSMLLVFFVFPRDKPCVSYKTNAAEERCHTNTSQNKDIILKRGNQKKKM